MSPKDISRSGDDIRPDSDPDISLQTQKLRYLEQSINEILDEELTAFLDYKPYDRSENKNSRNGTYSRIFKTPIGDLHLRIPRDREGKFTSVLLPKFARTYTTDKLTVVNLFEPGLSQEEIVTRFRKLCGTAYSRQAISRLSRIVLQKVMQFSEMFPEEKEDQTA